MHDADRQRMADRLRHQAHLRHIAVQRLRRRVAFERILARIAKDSRWVLKGGFCLELRLDERSRATKDLDLATQRPLPRTAVDVQDLLDDILECDAGDLFTFEVGLPRSITVGSSPTWRISVRVLHADRPFDQVSLDVAGSARELDGAIDELVFPSATPGLEGRRITVAAVDIHQHAAEKVHAYARIYAHDRPSSRVKDLVDLVLLIECGLVDTDRFGTRLKRCFEVRDGGSPPEDLPRPPRDWATPFADLTSGLSTTITSLDDGYRLVRTTYLAALQHQEPST